LSGGVVCIQMEIVAKVCPAFYRSSGAQIHVARVM
jgi:hypothetical protein